MFIYKLYIVISFQRNSMLMVVLQEHLKTNVYPKAISFRNIIKILKSDMSSGVILFRVSSQATAVIHS